MGVVGHQDYWPVGGRAYFKLDNDVAGNQFAAVDLGILDSVSPAISPSEIQVEDTDGGIRRLVEKTLVKLEETYEIRTKNVSPRNLSYLFLGKLPEDFTQAQTEKVVTTRAFPKNLMQLHDSDVAKTRLFNLDAFGGLYTGAVATKTLITIVKATKTLTLSGDHTAVVGLAPGKSFIVHKLGLTKIANSNSYTIVTRTLNGGNTDLTVTELPDGNESGITGQVTHEDGGSVYKRDVDWKLVSLVRSFVSILAGGAISTEQDLSAVFTVGAISGNRLIKPLSKQGAFVGTFWVWFGRHNNDQQTVREFRGSMIPGNPEFQLDDYSTLAFSVTALSDITITEPSGRILYVKGTLPTES